MAAAVTNAVHEYDANAVVRAEVSSQRIMINGDLSVAQAKAALFASQCEATVLQDGANPVHIQGGHTCCGHCV